MIEAAIDQARLVACAQELVRTPSENPPGDEAAVAEVAARWCRDAGLDVEIVTPAPGRANVVATLDTGRPGRTLAFNGHIDVVPAMDHALWAYPPYDAVVRNDILHGRGSADMKGACAAAIEAARALANVDGIAGRFVLQLVADEEVFGPHGMSALIERGLHAADAAIVGEPTELTVGIAQRGFVWARIRTLGTAAHGSMPDRGISAIDAMARVILAIREAKHGVSHPLLGEPTANVGVITGGAKMNIVAAECAIEVDRRTLPNEVPDEVVADLTRIAADAAAPARVEVEVVGAHQGYDLPESEELVQVALAAHEAVAGERTRVAGMVGATDAARLIATGVPAIVFGPGSLGVAHGTSEHVAVADLTLAAKIYARMAVDYLAAP